jgi:hypothetical protein
MTKRYFPPSHEINEGADIPGAAGKGGTPGASARRTTVPDTGGGLSGGADAGNTGAGHAGGDVESGGVTRSPDKPAKRRR